MTKVIDLSAQDLLCLTSIDLALNGQSVTIGGKNKQGKSSTQQAMKMILGGKDFVPAEPVRRGAKKGTGRVTLDNGYVVDFSVTPDRKTKLKITHRDNPDFDSDSVTLLKNLFGELSFDPGEWMDSKEKLETLRQLAGIDFTELNQKRQEAYDERTDVGREQKRLEGQLSGLRRHDGVPKAEESSTDLLAQIGEAQDLASHRARLEAEAERHAGEIRRQQEEDTRLQEEIKRLEAKRVAIGNAVGKLHEQRKLAEDAARSTEVPDVEPLKARLSGIEETNRKVRENREYASVKARLDEARSKVEELTEAIGAVDQEKKETLAKAMLPVEGLAFDEESIRFNDTPWDQCSESEQWEVATAIAFALNPESIVFMSKSGGLDKDTRARVLERAASLGVQLVLEIVDDAEDVQILIHHGEVVEDRRQTASGPAVA